MPRSNNQHRMEIAVVAVSVVLVSVAAVVVSQVSAVAVPVPVVLVKIDLFLGMCSSGSSPGARATRFSGNIHSRFAPTVSLWRCFTICSCFRPAIPVFFPHRHPSPPRVREADFGGRKTRKHSKTPHQQHTQPNNSPRWFGVVWGVVLKKNKPFCESANHIVMYLTLS